MVWALLEIRRSGMDEVSRNALPHIFFHNGYWDVIFEKLKEITVERHRSRPVEEFLLCYQIYGAFGLAAFVNSSLC